MLLVIIQIVLSLLTIPLAWFGKQVFDMLGQAVLSTSNSLLQGEFVLILVGQALITSVTQGFTYLNAYFESLFSDLITVTSQGRIFRKMAALKGLHHFEDPAFHNMLQLGIAGGQQAQFQVLTISVGVLDALIRLMGFAWIVLLLSPYLIPLIIFSTIPRIYVEQHITALRIKLAQETSGKERKASYALQIIMRPDLAKELKLYNAYNFFINTYNKMKGELNLLQWKRKKQETLWQSTLSIFSNLFSSTLFIVVAVLALQQRISIGDVILYLSAVSNVESALVNLISTVSRNQQNLEFYKMYRNILDLKDTIICELPMVPIPNLVHGIEFRDVSFRYTSEQPWVLNNLNMFIPSGKTVAIVGTNGVGKTTLVKLLTRLYDPTSGEILWDGINIRRFDIEELRKKLAVILQDFGHYDLTVRENIALGLGNEGQNMQEIKNAAVKAGISELILKYPSGYDTLLSRYLAENESGIDLSGGQWQKLALARMLMRNGEVQILDEPTSALDPQAEYELFEQFSTVFAGKTTLIISHRFTTVKIADYVAVLEAGHITEMDKHEVLIERGGTYARLYSLQANRFAQGEEMS